MDEGKVFHELLSAGLRKKEVVYVTRRDDRILWILLKDGTMRSVTHEGPIPDFVPTRDPTLEWASEWQ